MRIHPEKKIGMALSLYQTLLQCILSSPPRFSKTVRGVERRGRAKQKGKKHKTSSLRFIFKLTYQMCSLSAFCLGRVHFTLQKPFSAAPNFYNPWNFFSFFKLDLSSGAHMGNQMLPSIPAASSLCMKNVCRSLSTVWNYSPGWAEKRQSAKECHLDSTQCPLICHDSPARHRHNL